MALRRRFLRAKPYLPYILVVLLGLTAGALAWPGFGMGMSGGTAAPSGGQAPQAATETAAAVSIPPIGGNPYLIADVVEQTQPAVVYIRVTYRPAQRSAPRQPGATWDWDPWLWAPPREQESEGTGFVFREDGYVLTNQHVVDRERQIDRITVTMAGRQEPLEAELVGYSIDLDLAVLKLKEDGPLPVIPLGDSDRVRVGEWLIAIGNPYRFEHTVTVGVLSAKGRQIEVPDMVRGGRRVYNNLIQTDAAINPGNSGGPLLNLAGEVIGINTAVAARAQGIGFAIPINDVKQVLDDLIARGQVVYPYIGISYASVDAAVVRACNLRTGTGIVVAEVRPHSPAEQAGLQVCDVIVRADESDIASAEDFAGFAQGLEVGRTVGFLVEREGRRQLVQVEVGEWPRDLPRPIR